MNNGWIKLHRSIRDKGYYQDSQYVHLWLHLMLLASHDETEFLWNGKIVKLKGGQFVTGRQKMAKETGINEYKIERILKCFETEQQIAQQKTSKYRLITILNWDKYQKLHNDLHDERTTTAQPLHTFKNYKKVKNKTPAGDDPDKNTFLKDKQWNELIDAFADVNPMYTQFYYNVQQRKALDELAKTLGFDKCLNTIKALKSIISKPYAPRITSPIDLKRDLGKLVTFYNQEKNKEVTGSKFNQPNFII